MPSSSRDGGLWKVMIPSALSVSAGFLYFWFSFCPCGDPNNLALVLQLQGSNIKSSPSCLLLLDHPKTTICFIGQLKSVLLLLKHDLDLDHCITRCTCQFVEYLRSSCLPGVRSIHTSFCLSGLKNDVRSYLGLRAPVMMFTQYKWVTELADCCSKQV
ncbi:hypothetical protein ElyMa_004034900 [Elysia marginata]|uniref:Uncharacterized protein n=1 Tax=Elysia marginata TaxID=1093978 RepID=A0AAV4G2L7_9GAST|nr:hypothetical protein ElyMa_004034900 [Elysia marginata]